MSEIVADPNLIAYCGLYCGACGAYRRGKCPGCKKNEKATWCQVRACNREYQYASCADCTQVKQFAECRKLNNFISKIFAILYRSDRPAGLARIKREGYEAFARTMAEQGLQAMKRK
jgi:hypothetical protein